MVCLEQSDAFQPTLRAAREQLARFRPEEYARSRNHLQGEISRLSAYLTHGFLTLPEVFHSINARARLDPTHKFVFELGWRAYYRHVWQFLGDGIHHSIRPGPLPDDAYRSSMPKEVIGAQTGIAAIDRAVRQLYSSGYIHNHARMWVASYLVHLRKIHWHCGAQWMLAHLLDGDVASNHLSWQWVAGTNSVKPYLFNAKNIAKFAPPEWHSSGSVIDVSYDVLDHWAHQRKPIKAVPEHDAANQEVAEPSTHTRPLAAAWRTPDSELVRGKDVWLVHPWAMRESPCKLPDAVSIGVALFECHQSSPWDMRRWSFVQRGMQSQVAHLWLCDIESLGKALARVRSVQWLAEPHVDKALAQISRHLAAHGVATTAHGAEHLFEPVADFCPSFSKWWQRTRLVP